MSNLRTEQEELERWEGLFVGQLNEEELAIFERAVKDGRARHSYEGFACQMLGLAKVRLVYVPLRVESP